MSKRSIKWHARNRIYQRDDWYCVYCGADLTRRAPTLDHVIPLSSGGRTRYENLASCCKPCNRGKCDKRLEGGEEARVLGLIAERNASMQVELPRSIRKGMHYTSGVVGVPLRPVR